ncbi:MAG TPA: TIGR02466 family protein, partial [Arenicellales bacterium]|nr:TIGR02466 family protein [Arenicellales bacterium]
MANRDFKPVATNKTEDRLFFHPVYMLDAEGLSDALGDYERFREVTSPASRTVKYDFHREPDFEPLTNLILEQIRGIGSVIFQYSDEYEYEITQMWMNCLRPGQAHHVHTHHNTLWSGVFYLNGEEREFPGISFENPFYKHYSLTYKRLNEYNGNNWEFASKKDRMCLFPSYLRHWVEPNRTDRERWG